MTPNEILDQLRSGDDDKVTAAIDDVRTNIDPALLPALGNALRGTQESQEVRLHILDALTIRAQGDKNATRQIGEAMLQINDTGLAGACLAALEKLDKHDTLPFLIKRADAEDARFILKRIVADLDTELKAATTEADRATSRASVNVITTALGDENTPAAVRTQLAALLGGLPYSMVVEKLCDVLQKEKLQDDVGSDEVLKAVVQSLREINDPDAVRTLCAVLEKGRSEAIRRHVAGTLGRFKQTETAIPALLRAVLTDADIEVRQIAKGSLEKLGGWQTKAQSLIGVVRDKAIDRATLDANSVVDAISADDVQQDNKLLVADYLIGKAVDFVEEPRITAVLAALIIACLGGSTAIAGERITRIEQDNNLQKLRIEVGGASALDPLLKQLEENLKTYFREPIHELNKATHASWLNTILWAKRGFITRMVMSVIVFIAGLILVFSSYVFVLTNKLTIEQTVGPGVAFISGLVAVIFSVYRGPLRDIRQSINDLGVASATFMAFVHGILETSHTFSYHYLQRGVSYEDLKASTKVIEDMVNNTIRLLDQDTGRRRANPATKASTTPTETKVATEPKSDDKSDDTGKK